MEAVGVRSVQFAVRWINGWVGGELTGEGGSSLLSWVGVISMGEIMVLGVLGKKMVGR